jgi:esterase
MRLHDITLGEAADGRTPVVLLHGLFGSARNLGGLQKALAARAMRVIALDLRNHGESPHASETGYASMAADVEETLAALDALPCRLLGHSMGGKVAMRFALAATAHIERLIVADIAPIPYVHGNRNLAGAMRALPLAPGMTRAEASAALAEAVPDPAVRSFLLLNLRLGGAEPPGWRIGLAELEAGMAAIEGWEDAGGAYPGPAFFLSGGRSPYVPETAHDAIRALFPRAAFATLPEAGHWLHAEDPAGFLAAILPFLDAKA